MHRESYVVYLAVQAVEPGAIAVGYLSQGELSLAPDPASAREYLTGDSIIYISRENDDAIRVCHHGCGFKSTCDVLTRHEKSCDRKTFAEKEKEKGEKEAGLLIRPTALPNGPAARIEPAGGIYKSSKNESTLCCLQITKCQMSLPARSVSTANIDREFGSKDWQVRLGGGGRFVVCLLDREKLCDLSPMS